MTENINLLRVLINCAEKASNIARVCRSNKELLALLVQEKTGTEANQRFEHDFKTLADVLIQETIKHEVGNLFPSMRDAILGEESTHFINKLGQQITIAVSQTESETASCLESVLDGNKKAAEALAAEVHRKIDFDATLENIPELPNQIDYSSLGIWIDPIDATAEYISGESIFTDFPGITSTGLDCVTVLIGVYERVSGIPIIGIVSQPFGHKLHEHLYSSSLFWGVCLPTLTSHNCNFRLAENPADKKIGIFSSSEDSKVLENFRELNYELAFSAGAGHKALKVICKDADIYLLSKGSTFRWDTCAPQAILRALGGDILDYSASIERGEPISIKYNSPEGNPSQSSEWKRNANGLIAVRDVKLLTDIFTKFSTM